MSEVPLWYLVQRVWCVGCSVKCSRLLEGAVSHASAPPCVRLSVHLVLIVELSTNPHGWTKISVKGAGFGLGVIGYGGSPLTVLIAGAF